MMEKKRVTGIGGIFFKSKDPSKTKEWYNEHLGLNTDQYGTVFETRKSDSPEQKNYSQWSPFKADTNYFEPSSKEYMFNYIVEDLEWLATKLKEEGVTICDEIETYDYGKFLHIMDNDGNKIELWEPIQSEFERGIKGVTK